MKKSFKILNDNGINNEEIQKCLSVLGVKNSQEIEEILIVLKENNISIETVKKCLTLLSNRKSNRNKRNF